MVIKYNLRKRINVINSDEQYNKVYNKKRKITEETEIVEEQNKRYKLENKEWVSATKVHNYLLNDPILDWLEMYYNEIDELRNNKIDITKEKKRLNILFEMGNKFEKEVYNYLINKFGNKNVQYVLGNNKYDVNDIVNNTYLTYNKMLEGVPILLQCPLSNFSNKTYGIADLLVRSDWLNKIVNTNILPYNEQFIKATKLGGSFHYRVIDIKWTTIYLCVDKERIRNSDRFPAYKGQLLIYNLALGELQGYTPNKTYILGKSWRTDKEEGYNCFELLGHIQFNDWDNEYINKTDNAIKWIRNLRENGKKWKIYPEPSVKELYPNMCHKNDLPYTKIKKTISKNINELTEIWMVGHKNRLISHKNGIKNWKDKKCNALSMGIKGPKISPIVNKILEINRDTSDNIILPKYINNNDYGWKNETNLDFYIDYEAINSGFYYQDINLTNSRSESGILFMIGVGYIENNKWVYNCFTMNNFSMEEEYNNINRFINYIDNKIKSINNKYLVPKFYHWGHAERTMFNNANNRHNNIWTNWKNNKIWIDLCNIFKKVPIVIKNAKKFSLKEIANALYGHKVINTCWSDDMNSGLHAMLEASEYYKFIDNYNKLSHKEQLEQQLELNNYKNIFNNIKKYNEVDCKVMWEIIKFIRSTQN